MAFANGDTFLYSDTMAPRHLHIVLCAAPNNSVVVVSVNTVNELTDTTTILQPGDHSFIAHESAVSYNWVRTIPLTVLEAADTYSQGKHPRLQTLTRLEPADNALLTRIANGAVVSKRTPKKWKRAIAAEFDIPYELPGLAP